MGYVPQRRLAVIEIAAAAAIGLIALDERDMLEASTFRVGKLISSALNHGATDVLIGLADRPPPTEAPACSPRSVSSSSMPAETASPREAVRSNVCTGSTCPNSTHGYATPEFAWPATSPRLSSAPPGKRRLGPRKGAAPADDARLESAMTQLASVTSSKLGHAEPARAGAGAAGGLRFALLEFLRAESQPGVQVVAETLDLQHAIAGADWVFTGEGSVDAQTVRGKTPIGAAQLTRHHDVPVIVFAGRVSPDAAIRLQNGVHELVTITPEGTPVEKARRSPTVPGRSA
jgi:glycerate kinase